MDSSLLGTIITIVSLLFAILVIWQQTKANRKQIETQLKIAEQQIAAQLTIAKTQIKEQAYERWSENLRNGIAEFDVALGELSMLLSYANGLEPEETRKLLTHEKKTLEFLNSKLQLMLNGKDELHVKLGDHIHQSYRLVLELGSVLGQQDEEANSQIARARSDLIVLAYRVIEGYRNRSEW